VDGKKHGTKGEAFSACWFLRDVCQHPFLLSRRWSSEFSHPDRTEFLERYMEYAKFTAGETSPCAKIGFLLRLLSLHREAGHRTLVFSSRRGMLDVIASCLEDFNNANPRGRLEFDRIDGEVPIKLRQGIIDRFNSSSSGVHCLLLTTQVGGVGLTATGANRVVIIDPNWNPKVDAQAVNRAYRIGQVRNVMVYRLITCGTIEDHCYRKQLFKGSLSDVAIEGEEDFLRLFTTQEMKRAFKLGDSLSSETEALLTERKNSPQQLPSHPEVRAILNDDIVAGVTLHHSAGLPADWEEESSGTRGESSLQKSMSVLNTSDDLPSDSVVDNSPIPLTVTGRSRARSIRTGGEMDWMDFSNCHDPGIVADLEAFLGIHHRRTARGDLDGARIIRNMMMEIIETYTGDPTEV